MSQFKSFNSLITISPLGLMYGSAGGFLSANNLVGVAHQKFPPDAATVAGLLFHASQAQNSVEHEWLRNHLTVAGPFWAKRDNPSNFYVPIPWHHVIGKGEQDEWYLVKKNSTKQEASEGTTWYLNQQQWKRSDEDIKPAYFWQPIKNWNSPIEEKAKVAAEVPWSSVSFLHPKLKHEERVVEQGDLFLENAVQLHEDYCLVYLSNLDRTLLDRILEDGWYRFGGEGHMVEVESHPLTSSHQINRLLNQKIGYACALITPGIWGSNNHSYRYPNHPEFPSKDLKLLTDKPVTYRYRIGQSKEHEEVCKEGDCKKKAKTGRLSRGRYAVPAGSVYVFREPLGETWWSFPEEWFPKEGFRLKHLGCGLCLPIEIQGVPECTEKLAA